MMSRWVFDFIISAMTPKDDPCGARSIWAGAARKRECRLSEDTGWKVSVKTDEHLIRIRMDTASLP